MKPYFISSFFRQRKRRKITIETSFMPISDSKGKDHNSEAVIMKFT